MPQRVEFEGQIHEFPDDFSPNEISAALSGSTNTPAPPAGPVPGAKIAPPIETSTGQIPWQQQAPAAPPPAALETVGRRLAIGAQGAGAGVAELVGMPVDLMNLALKPVGLDSERPIGGAQSIKDLGTSFLDALSVAPYERGEMSAGEELGYDVNRFGSQALGGGAALARKAATTAASRLPSVADAFLDSYRANAGRTLAVDTAAGAGSGVGVNAANEYIPPEVMQGSAGPLIETGAALLGGVGGATLGGATVAGKKGVESVVKAPVEGYRIAKNVPKDPETGMPVTNRVTDKAAVYLQDSASNLPAAKKEVADGAQFYKDQGLPSPATGSLSNDPGLISVERTARDVDPVPFLERDRALRESQADLLKGMAPEVKNPRAAQDFTAREAEARVASARGATDAKKMAVGQAEQAEIDAGTVLRTDAPERKIEASERLDEAVVEKTMRPMQQTQRDKYAAIDPEGAVKRDVEPLIGAVQDLRRSVPESVPADEVLPEKWLRQIESLAPKDVETGVLGPDGKPVTRTEGGTVSFKDLNEMRPFLAKAIQSSRVRGDFARADALRTVKGFIDTEAERLAAEGGEAGLRAQEAVRYTRDEMAPKFGQGEGGRLRADLNADDPARSATPKTATAGRFLKIGEGSKEVAADLKRILAGSEAEGQGAAAARDYLVADMAKVVGADGKVNPAHLRGWLANREGVFQSFPEFKTEAQNLLNDVMNKRSATGRLKQDLDAAVAQLKRTERDVDSGVFRVFANSEPQNAAGKVLRDADPEKRMDEVLKLIGKDKQATAAFKRATAEFIESTVTGARTEGTGTESYAVLQSKFEQFIEKTPGVRAAIGKLYADEPQAMNVLNVAQRIGRDLAKSNIQAKAGSATAANDAAMGKWMRTFEIGVKSVYGGLRGGNIARNVRLALQTIPGFNDDAAIQRLVLRAQLDPELALHLYGREVDRMPAKMWVSKLNRLIGYGEGARAAQDDGDENR